MNREIVGGGGASVYPLIGDVQSTAGNAPVTVIGLRGILIEPSFPVNSDVLTYDETSNMWVPTPITGIELQTNGADNSTQTLLNLADSASVTVSESGGTITFTATGGGGGVTRSATTTNANGSFFTWSDGLIEQWGQISVTSSGNEFNTAVITFPTNFTVSPPNIELNILGLPNSGSSTDTADAQVDTATGTGAVCKLQCNVPTGGGGTTFNQTVVLQWIARGL